MIAISRHSTVKASDRQMSADLAGETVLLNYGDGVYYSLNEVGARVWTLVQETRSVQDVLDTLLGEYDTEEETCEKDLCELLNEMAGLGLVDIADGQAP